MLRLTLHCPACFPFLGSWTASRRGAALPGRHAHALPSPTIPGIHTAPCHAQAASWCSAPLRPWLRAGARRWRWRPKSPTAQRCASTRSWASFGTSACTGKTRGRAVQAKPGANSARATAAAGAGQPRSACTQAACLRAPLVPLCLLLHRRTVDGVLLPWLPTSASSPTSTMAATRAQGPAALSPSTCRPRHRLPAPLAPQPQVLLVWQRCLPAQAAAAEPCSRGRERRAGGSRAAAAAGAGRASAAGAGAWEAARRGSGACRAAAAWRARPAGGSLRRSVLPALETR